VTGRRLSETAPVPPALGVPPHGCGIATAAVRASSVVRSSAAAATDPAELLSSLPPAPRAPRDDDAVLTRGELFVVALLFLAGSLLDWLTDAGRRVVLGGYR
jgi:hypothetical protein